MTVPSGFEDFWRDTAAAAEGLVLDFDGPKPSDRSTDSHIVQTVTFRGADGSPRHAWLATPREAKARRGFLWIPPYSRWSMKPDQYGTRPGHTSLSPNLLGEGAFHEESYTPERGYFAEGVGSPETWVFRRLFQDCVLAVRLLQELGSLEPSRTGAMGMSQGGGLAIWLAAWTRSVAAVVADMPFLGMINQVLAEQRAFRYPLKELADWRDISADRPTLLTRTLDFYDTVNQARFCRVPTLVTLGLKDPAVRPFQAEAVYEALPGEKHLEKLDWGHDWHPSMVQRNQNWLDAHLAP